MYNYTSNIMLYINYVRNCQVFFTKKYVYTINHKRIALNYLYFSIVTGLTGVGLATMIRIELAAPGSYYFYGDSIRYLQIITIHALIMIFFVAIPLLFGFLANFFIPYHIGSKDVAFPRLNSIALWLQILSYTLVSRLSLLRQNIWEGVPINSDSVPGTPISRFFEYRNHTNLDMSWSNLFNMTPEYLQTVKKIYLYKVPKPRTNTTRLDLYNPILV